MHTEIYNIQKQYNIIKIWELIRVEEKHESLSITNKIFN